MTPTAKSILALAAQATGGVGIRPRTVGPAASLAAQRLLLQQTLLHLDLTADAALPSAARRATPMVLSEAVAHRTDTVGKQLIIAVLDARVDATADPVVVRVVRTLPSQRP